MDFGEQAFKDTIKHLRHHGIIPLGAVEGGAKRYPITPILNINGIRVGFVAYNLLGPDITFAHHDQCGVVPLNPLTVKEGLQRLRKRSDCVIASVHWGVEGGGRPVPQIVDLAHSFIDSGVDIILGHHPHVPGPIEVYRGGLIFYSLGNFIFGHTHQTWGDNIVARLIIDTRRLSAAIVPIGTTAAEQFQPYVFSGSRAERTLRSVAALSAELGTSVEISDTRGSVEALRSNHRATSRN